MRNILLLVSTNNKEFNSSLTEIIEETWAKDIIDGKYPNISFYIYTAMDEDMRETSRHKTLGYIDDKCNSVFVPTGDSIIDSYNKTMCTLKTLHNKVNKADYIFKTTINTYVNVSLLNTLVQNLPENDERIFCGTIISSPNYIAPYSYCVFAKGDGILMPVKYYKDILSDLKMKALVTKNDKVVSSEEIKLNKKKIDDTAFGCIIDTYLLNNEKNHVEYYQDWGAKNFRDVDMNNIHKQLTIMMGDNYDVCVKIKNMKLADMLVKSGIEKYGNDISEIVSYMNDKETPVITRAINEEHTEFKKYTYDEFMNFLANETDVPYVFDSNGNSIVPEQKPTSNTYIIDGYNLSFDQFYNIPHRELTIETHYTHRDVFNSSLVDS